VIRTLKWFLQNSRVTCWRNLVLGGTIAISPAFVLAGDKDKEKDNDRSNRQGQASSARQIDAGGSSHRVNGATGLQSLDIPRDRSQQVTGGARPVFSSQGGPNKFDSDKIRSFRSVDDPGKNAIKGLEPKRINQDSDSSAKKKFDGTELKKLDRQVDPKPVVGSGKSNNSDERRLNSRSDDLNKQLRTSDDKGIKKLVRPEDLKKNLNQHPDLVKPLEFDKKHKEGDFKLGHGDAKNDDGKKGDNFLDQHKNGKFDGVVKGAVAKKLDLGKQFELKHKGDLTLKLNLEQKVKLHGGWSKSHWAGLIGPGFGVGCSPIVYCGPGYFPSHCLYPCWSPWVEYCWWFRCDPICDPRPWFCRPWIYEPCPVWVWWNYPVWYELPAVACGTWVDVEPVVIDDGLDLQLLAVRFVDPGQPELREGPRYRVWARNNSARTIIKDFNILLMAANSHEAVAGLPQAGVRVDSIEPGEIKAFDIRLPFESTVMNRDAEGNAIPFSQLHVLVDSHREIPEIFEQNNGAVIARGDVLPVDPVIFGSDSVTPVPGTEINIAGEGFGPEPGQVLVHVGGIELQAEIEGWYDLGVRVKLPALALASPTDAELVLVRGDTAASNPLTVQLTMPVAAR
jgi:hypothetical protein